MRFLIDRCAGTFIAEWLRTQGHDVVESRERGPDPGDRVLLEWLRKNQEFSSPSTQTLDNWFSSKVSHTAA